LARTKKNVTNKTLPTITAGSRSAIAPKINLPMPGRLDAISMEDHGPVSQGVPTKPIADRAFGLQNGCRRQVPVT